ncbi:hypothetical protein NEMBOFW57_007646 [Staphylotrichum longicolle]|uniref:Uncharacterized protein n=1 Tax=Staphylotrichum longicolle TaxID=669026 RepID=A0AAD4I0M6_9PEZI|nr:hypothetical protein NEMBOFW57_007646 [Staphylotrichum longicolle]
MQLTTLTVLLAAAGVAIATPVSAGQPASELTPTELPAGVTFIASNAVSGVDHNKSKRGTPTDACIGTCWSGYSSGMKCGYKVGTCQDKRWNE